MKNHGLKIALFFLLVFLTLQSSSCVTLSSETEVYRDNTILTSGFSSVTEKNNPSTRLSSTSDVEDVLVSPLSSAKYTPEMAVDTSGTLWTAYTYYYSSSSEYRLDVYKSIDSGSTWTIGDYRVSSSNVISNPDIAIDLYSDYVYVVYQIAEATNSSSGNIEIFRYSYGDTYIVDGDTYNQQYPSIAIESTNGASNYMIVAYEQLTTDDDRELAMKRSSDHGFSWQDWHNRGFETIPSPNNNVYTHMDLAIDFTRTVYLSYAFGADYSTLVSIKVEYGTITSSNQYFENSKTVYTASTGTVSKPAIAVTRGSLTTTIAVAFVHSKDVFIAYSYDAGSNWGTTAITAYTGITVGTSPNIMVDRMDTTSNVNSGNFYMSYVRDNTLVNAQDTYSILRAPYSDLGSWSSVKSYTGNLYLATSRLGMATFYENGRTVAVCFAGGTQTGVKQIYASIFEEQLEITVTNPVSSSDWTIGSQYTIQWTTIGSIDYVDIYLGKSGSFIGFIEKNVINDGSYSWTVITGGQDPGTDYWIYIEDSANIDIIYDYSDYFTITDSVSLSITITNPSGSADWEIGTQNTIQWTSTGSIDNVDIYMVKGSSFLGYIALGESNDGTYEWTVLTGLVSGSDYRIYIEDTDNVDVVYDYSEFFTVSDAGSAETSITVSIPNDTTNWTAGTLKTITWSWTGDISHVNIWFYKGLDDTGVVLGYIAQNTPNTGSYSWGIPSNLETGTDYWLEVKDVNSDVHGFSTPFTIVAAEISTDPSIFITGPNEVSAWRAGALYTISWNSQYDLGLVTISLLKGGDLIYVISDSIDGSANYDWVIPSDTAPGTDYRIMIIVNDNQDMWGMSDEFRILELETTTTAGETNLFTSGFELAILITGVITITLRRKYVNKRKGE